MIKATAADMIAAMQDARACELHDLPPFDSWLANRPPPPKQRRNTEFFRPAAGFRARCARDPPRQKSDVTATGDP